MLRNPLIGHRNYSITHRAVQRLRELVPGLGEADDENLRDRLDTAIAEAEDGNRAIKTLDVMLGEPQVIVPLENFGELLFAIIKEDTVVTVLPKSHGEEILQRGQAFEQKVASGEVSSATPDPHEDSERWDLLARRRWRRETVVPVIERVRNVAGSYGVGASAASQISAAEIPAARTQLKIADLDEVADPEHGMEPSELSEDESTDELASPIPLSISNNRHPAARLVAISDSPKSPIVEALLKGLDQGKRRAAVEALRYSFQTKNTETQLLPLWNELAEKNVLQLLTVGDLLSAAQVKR